MDAKLSEFITRTSADPGLARDLLESHSWNLKNALNAFYVMKGIATLDTGDVNDQSFSKKNSPSHQSVSNNIIIPMIPSNLKSSSEPSLSPSPTNSTNSSPSKLAISRLDVSDTDILDELYPKKLSRGISRAADNVFLVSRARNQFAYDFGLLSGWTPDEKEETDHEVNELKKHRQSPIEAPFTTTPEYTFTLPDLSIHPPDFSQFLEKDLIEKSSLVSLEGAGRLNWWTESGICQKLWPLATTGDGNCLLHAASLGIWGFHDRLLTLRKALHAILEKSKMSDSFYRRWRFQSSQQNRAAGLILCEDEWQKEWKSLLNMASTRPRVRHSSQPDRKTALTGGKKADSQIEEEEPEPHVYESLEELHILALAHVLRRPIIVVADTMLKDVTGEPFAPIPFGGIYLPLEYSEQECHRSPLCLTYDAAHFSALVAMDKESFVDSTPLPPAAIPLEEKEGKLLPLQFAIDPGIDVDWSHSDDTRTMTDDDKLPLLKKYLEVILLNPNSKQTTDVQDSQESCSGSHSLPKSNTNQVQDEKCSDPKVSEEHKSTSEKSRSLSPSSERQGIKRKMFEGLRHRFSFIRKSMSKRLRFKHLSTLAKRGTSFRFKCRVKIAAANNNCTSQNVVENLQETSHNATSATSSNSNRSTSLQQGIHCALLHTDKKHDYHEEMVRNYLTTARIRFMESQKKDQSKKASDTTSRSSTSSDSSTTSSSSSSTSKEKNDHHFASQCVNTGCLNYGTAATSYLCTSCFSDQKQEMEKQEFRVTKPSSLPTDSKATSHLKDKKETIPITDDGSEEDLKKAPNMISNESNLVNNEVISC